MFNKVPVSKVQAFWDSRPCNIRHSLSERGTWKYFDEVEARRYMVEPHIPLFAQFERWKGRKVLEIGCGIGTDAINFARDGAHVTAVDLSSRSIELARHRADIYGLSDRIRFGCADAERLIETVPSEPYDLVYSFGAIHHTPNPDRVISQIRQHYVQSGSILKAMLYHRYSWKVFWILATFGKGALWKLNDLIATYSEAQTGCPVTYTYTQHSARELLKGFEILDMRVEHIFPYRVRDYVEHRYVKEWYFRRMPATLFRKMEHLFGWHLCITARAS